MRYLICALLLAQATLANPIEVGRVSWGRDFDAALAESAESGKPVFAFFQEVPGCAGCKQFGLEVMSDPLIVAAIEEAFVPVLIFNNRGGKDLELIRSYREPAWNYQVMRFLDAEGKDIIPRKDRIWTISALAPRMIEALERADRPVPRYLVAAASETADSIETIAIAQACFWSGERLIGTIDGVVATEAGWLDGREVTRVRYLPETISRKRLVRRAAELGVGDQLYTELREYRPARESDQKKQLEGTPFAQLEMTPMQRTKTNAWARTDPASAIAWLTPAQRDALP